MTGTRGRRLKQLLEDVKEMRGYWKSTEETLNCTVYKISFGRGYKPAIRQSMKWMNGFDRTMYISALSVTSNIKSKLMSFDRMVTVSSSRPNNYSTSLPTDFGTSEIACLLEMPRTMVQPRLVQSL